MKTIRKWCLTLPITNEGFIFRENAYDEVIELLTTFDTLPKEKQNLAQYYRLMDVYQKDLNFYQNNNKTMFEMINAKYNDLISRFNIFKVNRNIEEYQVI